MKNAARACAISTIAQCVTSSLSAQISSAASSTPKISTCRSPKRNSKASRPKPTRASILKEFIPLASVDPVYFENTHYLGADKGGEKPYRLLADAMAKSGRVAIAELVSRGKEQLVLDPAIPQKGWCFTRCITLTRCGTSNRCRKART